MEPHQIIISKAEYDEITALADAIGEFQDGKHEGVILTGPLYGTATILTKEDIAGIIRDKDIKLRYLNKWRREVEGHWAYRWFIRK